LIAEFLLFVHEVSRSGRVTGEVAGWPGRLGKVGQNEHNLSTNAVYICFRKTSGSNTGAPNLLLAPGSI